MAEWHDVETDDPPPYGVDVWIHREPGEGVGGTLPILAAYRRITDFGDEWCRPSDPLTAYTNVVAWAPIETPVAPVRVRAMGDPAGRRRVSLFDDLADAFPEHPPDDGIDLAKVAPCPNCGAPVRRFSSVPIAGAGTSLVFSGPWWCDSCLRAKTRAAAAGIVRAVTTTKENP